MTTKVGEHRQDHDDDRHRCSREEQRVGDDLEGPSPFTDIEQVSVLDVRTARLVEVVELALLRKSESAQGSASNEQRRSDPKGRPKPGPMHSSSPLASSPTRCFSLFFIRRWLRLSERYELRIDHDGLTITRRSSCDEREMMVEPNLHVELTGIDWSRRWKRGRTEDLPVHRDRRPGGSGHLEADQPWLERFDALLYCSPVLRPDSISAV
jgi:hypothetical protein